MSLLLLFRPSSPDGQSLPDPNPYRRFYSLDARHAYVLDGTVAYSLDGTRDYELDAATHHAADARRTYRR